MADPNGQSQETSLRQPSDGAQDKAQDTARGPFDRAQDRLGKRILVVEDELETAEMLYTYFEFRGYEVLSTAWGKDVLGICLESHPDLIILDVQLPDTNAYEVYQELGNTQQTSHIPVIFLTKLVDDDLKAISREMGVLHYITKPFDLKELEQRVQDALR
jgi:DNA-binding response OmpR family regulator